MGGLPLATADGTGPGAAGPGLVRRCGAGRRGAAGAAGGRGAGEAGPLVPYRGGGGCPRRDRQGRGLRVRGHPGVRPRRPATRRQLAGDRPPRRAAGQRPPPRADHRRRPAARRLPVGRPHVRGAGDGRAGDRLPRRARPGRAGPVRHQPRVGDAGHGGACALPHRRHAARGVGPPRGRVGEPATAAPASTPLERHGPGRHAAGRPLLHEHGHAGCGPGPAGRGDRGGRRVGRQPGPTPADRLAYAAWLLELEENRDRFRDRGVPIVAWDVREPLAPVVEEVAAFQRYARHRTG